MFEYTGCLRRTSWLAYIDSPNIRNPMGNLIRIEIKIWAIKGPEFSDAGKPNQVLSIWVADGSV